MKKKVLIIINSELYVRNYLKKNIFDLLQKKYDVYYLFNKSIKNTKVIKKLKNFKGYYKYTDTLNKLHTRNFNVIMWRFRKLSKSFQFRIKWFSEIEFSNFPKNKIKEFELIYFKILQILKFRIYIQFFGSKIIYPIYKYFFIDRLEINKNLQKKIQIIKPNIIILPTQSQTPCDNDIGKISLQEKIKTLFIVDNWDNLSDKSKIIYQPDYITVWGQQTKEHAIRIQGISSDRIFKVGTPRFDNYFRIRNNKIKNIFNFRYILFLGTALKFNEERVIKEINSILSGKPFNKKIKLLYRPHPWRMSKETINLKDLQNVVIDPQIKNNYNKKNIDLSFQPSLDYYPALIKNSEFVVGGLTSMIIESLIFYKKYIISALPEKTFNNQYNSLLYHEHFKELKKVKDIEICTDLKYLKQQMIKVYNLRKNIDKVKTDSIRNYFLYNNRFKFNKNLHNIIKKIT